MNNIRFKKIGVILLTSSVMSACSTTQPIIQTDFNRLHDDLYAQPISGELTMADVIAYALLRNGDAHVKQLETRFAQVNQIGGNFSLLPKLDASLNTVKRDELLLTTSSRLDEVGEETDLGDVDVVPSFSSEKETTTSSIGLKWNLTNLLEQYYINQQTDSEAEIARLNQIRAIQNVVRDAKAAAYLAYADQVLSEKLETEARALEILSQNRCESAWVDKSESAVRMLDECQNMLSTSRSFSDTSSRLAGGKIKLAAIMTTSPDSPFTLAPITFRDPGQLRLSEDEFVRIGLRNRPELVVEEHKKQIARIDGKRAWSKVIPGIEVGYAVKTTDNPFTVNDSWAESYINYNLNVIDNLIQAPIRAKVAKVKAKLAGARQEPLVVSVVTQTHLAVNRYDNMRENFLFSTREHNNRLRKLEISANSYQAGSGTEVGYLIAKAEALRAEVNKIIHYADMQDALAQLHLSIGHNLVDYDQASFGNFPELTRTIEMALKEANLWDA